MPVERPEPAAAYFVGKNNHDIDAMLAPFAEVAIVKDEGQERRGPVELRHVFSLAGKKISVLEIVS